MTMSTPTRHEARLRYYEERQRRLELLKTVLACLAFGAIFFTTCRSERVAIQTQKDVKALIQTVEETSYCPVETK